LSENDKKILKKERKKDGWKIDHRGPSCDRRKLKSLVGYYARHGSNLCKSYGSCTFEFLISATPYLQIYYLGVYLGRLAGKIPTAGASGRGVHQRSWRARWHRFNLSVALKEGAAFVFGSWVCIAYGSHSFDSHLTNPREPKSSTPISSRNIDELADNLGKIQISLSTLEKFLDDLFQLELQPQLA
jgi:hypothetical protein